MKKSSIKTIHLFITALIIISAFVGCNRTKADSNIVYTNLVSQHAQNKLSEIMTYAGISDNRQNILIEHIKQFNSYVNQVPGKPNMIHTICRMSGTTSHLTLWGTTAELPHSLFSENFLKFLRLAKSEMR